MNERVMQFRIGMFVVVAILVLTMLIVWFEAPALVRPQRFVTVFFKEAPGIDRGIPVRKSGVRVGDVFSFAFTEAEQPEGVLVTLALEPEYALREGSLPRLGRALIGDVSIDLLPGTGPGPMVLYDTPDDAMRQDRWIKGLVAADPFLLLNDASEIFQSAGVTLKAIEVAADNLAAVAGKADAIDEFLDTWNATGRSIDATAADLGRVLRENEAELKPAVASFQSVASKLDAALDDRASAEFREALSRISRVATRLDETIDDDTADRLHATLDRVANASENLDGLLADLRPIADDLRAGPGDAPKTNLGQILLRTNRVAYDISILTAHLHDGQGRLNAEGTLQRLVADPKLYDDLRLLLRSATVTVDEARGVLRTFDSFAEKIARNPSVISEGVLNGR